MTSTSDRVTAGPALAWHLVTAGNVYHVDGGVDQLRAERSRQVVPAALDEDEIEGRELVLHRLDGLQVHRDVVPDGGVRASSRLDADDPPLRQHGGSLQELRVLAGEDVVGDGGDGELVSQAAAQLGLP